MNDDRRARSFETIIRVVVELLETEGYGAVQPLVVAKQARISLSTLYRFFPTRDALIVAALMRWMEANVYTGLADLPRDASLHEGLMWIYRQFFEAWERYPRMLEAYHRAQTAPGGDRIDAQGMAAVMPVVGGLYEELDPGYAEDVGLIMTNMICGLIQRAAVGGLEIRDILPTIERTLIRLTTDNAGLAAGERRRTRRSPRRRHKKSRGR